jgi:diguanylate cyclase (GGDEF)-like protein
MVNEEYSILNELEIGILIVDSSKRIEYCNRAAIDLLGKSGKKAQKYCYELLFGKESPCQKCFGDIKGQNSEIVEIELPDLDRFVEISVKKIAAGRILIQLSNITTQNRLREELNKSIISDQSSGLLKRNLIYNHLQSEMTHSRRFGRNLGFIMLRVSDLSNPGINSVSKIVARTIRGIGEILGDDTRTYDLSYRFGRDTFAVILPDENLEGTLTVSNRLYSKIKNLGIQRARIGASTMGSTTSPEEIIESAQRALYVAEHSDNSVAAI